MAEYPVEATHEELEKFMKNLEMRIARLAKTEGDFLKVNTGGNTDQRRSPLKRAITGLKDALTKETREAQEGLMQVQHQKIMQKLQDVKESHFGTSKEMALKIIDEMQPNSVPLSPRAYLDAMKILLAEDQKLALENLLKEWSENKKTYGIESVNDVLKDILKEDFDNKFNSFRDKLIKSTEEGFNSKTSLTDLKVEINRVLEEVEKTIKDNPRNPYAQSLSTVIVEIRQSLEIDSQQLRQAEKQKLKQTGRPHLG